MCVNFEVTDARKPVISVRNGCKNGSMTVFKPDGAGKILNDRKTIEKIVEILNTAKGFDIVDENGAYVLDATIGEMRRQAGKVYAAAEVEETGEVISDIKWKKALSQAAQKYEEGTKDFYAEAGREGHAATTMRPRV